MPLIAGAITRFQRREILIAWGHACFGISVKSFLIEKEK